MDNSLTELLDLWLTDLASEGKSAGTITAYRIAVHDFIDSGPSTTDQLSRAVVRRWLADSSGYARSYQAARFAALSVFCRWLHGEGLIDASPMTGLKRPTVRPAPVEPYTELEIEQLLVACGGRRDTAIITMLVTTGMRLSECATITMDAISSRAVNVHGKGGKLRSVPLSAVCHAALDDYLAERSQHPYANLAALWLGQRGPITTRGIDEMLRTTARRGGIEGVRAHKFRNAFAVTWLTKGGSESSLMALAGWNSLTMINRYVAARRRAIAHAEFHRLID